MMTGLSIAEPMPSATATSQPLFRPRSAWAIRTHTLFIVITFCVVAGASHLRWELAGTTTWQCDEIPLLTRFTGLCGHVTNEIEAAEFEPSLYTFRHGLLRGLRAPKFIAALHTTTNFWTNLTLHLFGITPTAGRLMPFVWSVVAIFAAAWAAWLVTRSIPAACAAAWMVALSPQAAAYGAQARGYAEAMALTPLLLIALEYFRRRPDRWLRALLVFVCALQLSLTVYTAWVYWVLPTALLSVLLLPRLHADPRTRRATRVVLLVLTLGLVSFMALFTLDRWNQFAFLDTHTGASLGQPGAIREFLAALAAGLLAAPIWLALAAIPGVVAVWKSPLRWWLWPIGAGIAVPAAFAVVRNTAGYPRHLGYLVVPIAILFGVGVDAIVRTGLRRYRPAFTAIVAGVIFAGASAWSFAGLEQRARAVILPDWGGMVLAIDQEPETVGPRWFCHCLANYWQINWYRTPQDNDACFDVPLGGRIELVMGAQFGRADKPKVFRVDLTRTGILEEDLPGYLAAVPPKEVRSGIELRRWVGTRVTYDALQSAAPETPVFVLAVTRLSSSGELDRRFREESNAYAREVVTFALADGTRSPIRSMMLPARALPAVHDVMRRVFEADREKVHYFSLSPLEAADAP